MTDEEKRKKLLDAIKFAEEVSNEESQSIKGLSGLMNDRRPVIHANRNLQSSIAALREQAEEFSPPENEEDVATEIQKEKSGYFKKLMQRIGR